jgi:transposase
LFICKIGKKVAFCVMDLPTKVSELQALILSLLSKIELLESRVLFLEAENRQLKEEDAVLKEENRILKIENTALYNQLGQNSGNSHNPPSTDKFVKKGSALPVSKGKKQGGQNNHKGNTLKLVSEADEVSSHLPKKCLCCGREISKDECEILVSKRQVFDIPVPVLEVTEHRLLGVYCCGKLQKGVYPAGVTAQVQYGNKILSMSSMLSVDFKLPFKKISKLFETLYGYKFNEATAISANEQLFEALLPVEQEIKAQILASEVVHFDETGLKVNGKLKWIHTASTDKFCYLFLHEKRGGKALQQEDSIIKDYTNWAVHDCWSSYFSFKDCKHAICNAHILRELQALKEQNSLWAEEMHLFLMELYIFTEKGKSCIDNDEQKAFWTNKYMNICKKATQQEQEQQKANGLKNARGKPKKSKGQALIYRLIKYQEAVLAFAFVKNVPFTNNIAEQAIRNVKIKQKIASFRTENGAKVYARIQGFINTIKKNAKNIFQEILNVFNQNPSSWKTT